MPKHRQQGRSGEVVYDASARQEYLTGFSSRKRQRRAYGLAMQKLKDRQAKLSQRKELKEAQLEQIQQAEQQKLEIIENTTKTTTIKFEKPIPKEQDIDQVQMYQDVTTQQQWGGQVIVTTSTHIPDDDDDHQDVKSSTHKKTNKKVDKQQEYAGKVDKYLKQIQKAMPTKKKKQAGHKRKGQHGAATMKGIGDVKTAQKMLRQANKKKR